MGKTYSGQIPTGDDWAKVGECFMDGVEWHAFRKQQGHDPDWSTYKVCANGRAPNKANYWFVRNDRTGQLGFAKDFAIMRDKRPDLHAQIEKILKGGSA